MWFQNFLTYHFKRMEITNTDVLQSREFVCAYKLYIKNNRSETVVTELTERQLIQKTHKV